MPKKLATLVTPGERATKGGRGGGSFIHLLLYSENQLIILVGSQVWEPLCRSSIILSDHYCQQSANGAPVDSVNQSDGFLAMCRWWTRQMYLSVLLANATSLNLSAPSLCPESSVGREKDSAIWAKPQLTRCRLLALCLPPQSHESARHVVPKQSLHPPPSHWRTYPPPILDPLGSPTPFQIHSVHLSSL